MLFSVALLALASLASCKPFLISNPPQSTSVVDDCEPRSAMPSSTASPNTKLLVGASGQILVAEYDGAGFTFTANHSVPGMVPSWMAFKEPNHIYAVDENSNETSHFTVSIKALTANQEANAYLSQYHPATNALQLQQTVPAPPGLVHFAFNWNQMRLIGSSYASGEVDVWDISNGTMRHLTKATWDKPPGPHELQLHSRAHQAVLEQTGRFFAVNDIGSDNVVLLDSWDDRYTIVTYVPMPTPGCGPRHGVFVPTEDGKSANLYVVVCEYQNTLEVFEVTYSTDSMEFNSVQTISTFGPDHDIASTPTAAAGAIAMSADGKHIYVSNRLTEQDSISHFEIIAGVESECENTSMRLAFVDQVPSMGDVPRMFALGHDETVLFSTNQKGGSGLVAFERDLGSGKLSMDPAGTVDASVFPEAWFGPQFVQQIAI